MKTFSLMLFSTLLFGQCEQLYHKFLVDEKAYHKIKKINVASFKAEEILQIYIITSQSLLDTCTDTISLDKQYLLKREIAKLKTHATSYKVSTLYQIQHDAFFNRETVNVYTNGTVTPVR